MNDVIAIIVVAVPRSVAKPLVHQKAANWHAGLRLAVATEAAAAVAAAAKQ